MLFLDVPSHQKPSSYLGTSMTMEPPNIIVVTWLTWGGAELSPSAAKVRCHLHRYMALSPHMFQDILPECRSTLVSSFPEIADAEIHSRNGTNGSIFLGSTDGSTKGFLSG